MPKTTLERLTEVEASITAIETRGQSYSTGDGRSLSRGDLKALYEERRKLLSELQGETQGAARAQIIFGGAC